MYDPIGGFNQIREHYIRYLETAFRIADPEMTKARRNLLELPGELCTEPYIEPIPRYQSVNWTISQIADSGTSALPHLTPRTLEILQCLLPAGLFDSPDLALYTHQLDMMRKGLQQGTPGIVTSGTGSGKTESFLLPIIAQFCEEASTSGSWHRPERSYLQRRWWHDSSGSPFEKFTAIPKSQRPQKKNPGESPFFHHRVGENRPAAVRALILYPMNALVEDQLARLRKALDSPEARSVVEDALGGNRFFFGRYTGQTPVTGYHGHPRLSAEDYRPRFARSLSDLFQASVEAERTQDWIRKAVAEGSLESDVPYLFPSVDGAEQISRWDMQMAPPDILISNISMLSAMLTREVDAPIFEATRNWLESDEDSYFFLVLDELHLHRGTAGTEVAYLLRLLLRRLGLTKPENQHKLRVLASSASLPDDGDGAERSRRFLEDMFGSHGLHSREPHGDQESDWTSAIVTGDAIYEPLHDKRLLDPHQFEHLTRELGGNEVEPVSGSSWPEDLQPSSFWARMATALGADQSSDARRSSVRQAARVVTDACWDVEEKRYRAVGVSDLSTRIFGSPEHVDAVRGVLLLRGLGDFLGGATDEVVEAQSFRLHTFFRAIEGLYSPLDSSLSAPFGDLSIERAYPVGGARPLDLLYCESCGCLLVGGRRSSDRQGGGQLPELTPVADNLEDVPEHLAADRFEDQTHSGYAVFFPSDRTGKPPASHSAEDWRQCWLDPVTGELLKRPNQAIDLVQGFLYVRSGVDRHRRSADAAGSHVPYQCPSCPTDYSRRRSGTRLSPIRHFRPGFAKTTQLLSSELFGLVRSTSSRPAKLVSFSDSRQEAAKAALDIEGRHHEDLRRQELLAELRRLQERDGDRSALEATAAKYRAAAGALGEDTPDGRAFIVKAQNIDAKLAAGPAIVGPISEILADPEDGKYRGARSKGRPGLGPLLATYVEKGVHPTDPAGVQMIKGTVGDEDRLFEWPELFEVTDGSIDWRDFISEADFVDSARQTVLKESHRNLTEVLFSKTYFAMEETGVGYPCLSDASADDTKHEQGSAFLRAFADSYRLGDSPFDEAPKPLLHADDFGKSNRARLFAEAIWGDEWRSQMSDFLSRLSVDGHPGGLIRTPRLFVRLVEPQDPAWRCDACSRVHLHLGVSRCTRCFAQLPENPSCSAGEIAASNYIGRKVLGSTEPFRLHCEELTGQTDDGAARQRAFKDVLIQDLRPAKNADGEIARDEDGEIIYADSKAFLPQRESIDLLTVTTTMEVGIDIGSLQAVVQANMPPQRFNYQQRVGRAGRRGQAFSVALTVCRTKSHDLHYFRNPRSMTGDVPPPPFLARSRAEIAERFLRKFWLTEAFAFLRSRADQWPADLMRPPDIHGEFVPTDEFRSDDDWPVELERALEATLEDAATFAAVLTDTPLLEVRDIMLTPADIVQEVVSQTNRDEVVQVGLAHTLAEGGLLPMYGMPTRTRDLFTGTRRTAEGEQWRTIDRDLDVAIFEFAPSATIIKDKRTHMCVGFTGPLPAPSRGIDTLNPYSEAFGSEFWMAECPACRSWYRSGEEKHGRHCEECGLELESWYRCREPLGFRTDFRPQVGQPDQLTGRRSRSVQAESFRLTPQAVAGTNAVVQVKSGARTYRMNRGEWSEEDSRWRGFTASRYTHRKGRQQRQLSITGQWLEDDAITNSRVFEVDLDDEGGRIDGVWLAAPKTTDLMLVAPRSPVAGLGLHHLERTARVPQPTPGDRLLEAQATAIRSAAFSASYLLVYRAALELDVDPEEFDIVEPRVASFDSHRAPVLQIADFLVNGAGLSVALGAVTEEIPRPLFGSILTSIVGDSDEYPLRSFAGEDHASKCRSACYRCMLRHSNQQLHGLLDWRLGLSYLSMLNSTAALVGLDGDFTLPWLSDWEEQVEHAIDGLTRRTPTVAPEQFGNLRGFRLRPGGVPVVVTHPLWDPVQPAGELKRALDAAGSRAVAIDSFTLARRPWLARERVRAVEDGPIIYTPVRAHRRQGSLVERFLSSDLPDPTVDYQIPGAPFGPVPLAWPTARQPTCFVETEDPERDAWLTAEGWAIFGPADENELVESLANQ